jgi:hypothetical protein
MLVGTCALSVATVAFLLGRATAPSSSRSSQAPAEADHGGAAPAGTPGRSAPGAPIAALDPVPPAPAGGTGDAGVAAYFAQMDELSAEAKASQDPQAVARTILDQAISGNMTGIDDLIAKQRTLAVRLGQVQPPPSCREHHERSVRLFGRAIGLLEKTRDAIGGQPADIASAATEGRAIEAEAKALDALANDIRRSAGLPPLP